MMCKLVDIINNVSFNLLLEIAKYLSIDELENLATMNMRFRLIGYELLSRQYKYTTKEELMNNLVKDCGEYKRNTIILCDFNLPSILITCHNIMRIIFDDTFNQPIQIGSLPSSLQQLQFGIYSRFNQPIQIGSLPSSLQQLQFGKNFNQPIQIGALPSSLQQLQFGFEFNQPIQIGSLPSSLQQLKFRACFNQPIQIGSLPSSLQQLHFGAHFNQSIQIGSLPSSLQQLQFGYDFNQPIQIGSLPNSLKILKFSNKYNYKHNVKISEDIKIEYY